MREKGERRGREKGGRWFGRDHIFIYSLVCLLLRVVSLCAHVRLLHAAANASSALSCPCVSLHYHSAAAPEVPAAIYLLHADQRANEVRSQCRRILPQNLHVLFAGKPLWSGLDVSDCIIQGGSAD